MNSSNNNCTWTDSDCSSSHSSPYLHRRMVPALSPHLSNGNYFSTLHRQELTPNWPEENMSVCSSTHSTHSGTPEVESQSLIEGLLSFTLDSSSTCGTITKTLDPTLYKTYSSYSYSGQEDIYTCQQQQLMTPMLDLFTPLLPSQSLVSPYYGSTASLLQQRHHHTFNAVVGGSVTCNNVEVSRSGTFHGPTYNIAPQYQYYGSPITPPSYYEATNAQCVTPARYSNNNSSAHGSTYSSSSNMRSDTYNDLRHQQQQLNSQQQQQQQQQLQQQQQQQFTHYIHLGDSEPQSSRNSNTPNTTTTSRTTTNKGRYACTASGCSKVFPRSYNLKSHMRTHTLERPFRCQYNLCSWTFARIHDLKRHELQHTGVKPHACDFCHRTFARSDALKRHWKVDVQCAQALEVYKFSNNGREPIGNRKRKAAATKGNKK